MRLAGVTITIGAGGAGSATGDSLDRHGYASPAASIQPSAAALADTYNASAFNNGFNSFQGQGGNDTITGNGATQVQYGNATAGVTITIGVGGTGSATGDGSVGTDTFTGGVNSATGGNLADTYNASGFVGFNSFLGQGGNDTITGNGNTQIQYNSATSGVSVNLSTGTASGDGSVGTDAITGGVNNVLGSNFNDTLTGGSSNDFLTANAGNDTINGRGGNDMLDGGQGFDRAIYIDATGPVTVNLAAGSVIGAGVGNDTLTNVEGVIGSNFADTYNSAGFTGNAVAPGTPIGFNEFEGGSGDDTITGNLNSQGAQLTRVSYVSASAGVTVDLVVGTADGDASVGHDTLIGSGFNGVWGSGFVDTINGTDNLVFTSEVFAGFAGNDLIDGRGGFDRADYNVDATTLLGITVNLAAGTVTGDATVGTDTLRSIEAVRGTNLVDSYNAAGFSGNSTNAGSLGTFNEFTGNGGDDFITGNDNTRLGFNNATGGVNVDFVTGIASGDASVGIDHFTGVNAVQASMFDDTLLGGSTNDTFTGLAGNDFDRRSQRLRHGKLQQHLLHDRRGDSQHGCRHGDWRRVYRHGHAAVD